MKFHPHNNTVLLKKVLGLGQYENDGGVILKKDCVDLYEVVELCPENESKEFTFKVGDIVTACATGTLIKDPSGEEFVLMNCDYVTSKILE